MERRQKPVTVSALTVLSPELPRWPTFSRSLAKEGKKLPILEGDDHTANFNYTKTFIFNRNKKLGEKYGLQWAEGYHYMTDIPFDNHVPNTSSPVEEYIKKNAIPG